MNNEITLREISEQTLNNIKDTISTPQKVLKLANLMNNFYNYSYRNQLLIMSQKPNALAIASFNKLKELGFYVNQGEKGIQIFAPQETEIIMENGHVIYKNKWTDEHIQKVESGEIKPLNRQIFVPTTVFDITQTTAKPEEYSKVMMDRPTVFDFKYNKENHDQLQKSLLKYIQSEEIEVNNNSSITSMLNSIVEANLHNPILKANKEYEVTDLERNFQREILNYMLHKNFGLDNNDSVQSNISNFTNNLENIPTERVNALLNDISSVNLKINKSIMRELNNNLVKEQNQIFEFSEDKNYSLNDLQEVTEYIKDVQQKWQNKFDDLEAKMKETGYIFQGEVNRRALDSSYSTLQSNDSQKNVEREYIMQTTTVTTSAEKYPDEHQEEINTIYSQSVDLAKTIEDRYSKIYKEYKQNFEQRLVTDKEYNELDNFISKLIDSEKIELSDEQLNFFTNNYRNHRFYTNIHEQIEGYFDLKNKNKQVIVQRDNEISKKIGILAINNKLDMYSKIGGIDFGSKEHSYKYVISKLKSKHVSLDKDIYQNKNVISNLVFSYKELVDDIEKVYDPTNLDYHVLDYKKNQIIKHSLNSKTAQERTQDDKTNNQITVEINTNYKNKNYEYVITIDRNTYKISGEVSAEGQRREVPIKNCINALNFSLENNMISELDKDTKIIREAILKNKVILEKESSKTTEQTVESSEKQTWKAKVEYASNINLVELAKENGILLEKNSSTSYRLLDNHSVVLNNESKGNYYYDFATNKGGNAIDFARNFLGKTSFKEAVEYLNDKTYVAVDTEVKQNKEPYVYDPSKEANSFDKARNYLVNERKISPEIVDQLHKEGLIKQDKRNNVLFLYKKDNLVVGASEQGTVKLNKKIRGRDHWKSIQKNSESWGFNFQNGTPKNLKFFEASIDALSYVSINGIEKDTKYIALEGLKDEKLIEHIALTIKEIGVKELKSVDICVDNDKAGREFADQMYKLRDTHNIPMNKNLPEIPEELQGNTEKWDWNDSLKYYINNLQNELQTKHEHINYNDDDITSNLLIDNGVDSRYTNYLIDNNIVKSFDNKLEFSISNEEKIIFDTDTKETINQSNEFFCMTYGTFNSNSTLNIFDNPFELVKYLSRNIDNPNIISNNSFVSMEGKNIEEVNSLIKDFNASKVNFITDNPKSELSLLGNIKGLPKEYKQQSLELGL